MGFYWSYMLLLKLPVLRRSRLTLFQQRQVLTCIVRTCHSETAAYQYHRRDDTRDRSRSQTSDHSWNKG